MKNTIQTRVKTRIETTTKLARKGFRAYVGLYKAAYEKAQPVIVKASKGFNDLAEKGETVETAAIVIAKDARGKAVKTAEGAAAKVRSVLPIAANDASADRIAELEAEVAKLKKKAAKPAAKKVAAPKVEAEKAA